MARDGRSIQHGLDGSVAADHDCFRSKKYRSCRRTGERSAGTQSTSTAGGTISRCSQSPRRLAKWRSRRGRFGFGRGNQNRRGIALYIGTLCRGSKRWSISSQERRKASRGPRLSATPAKDQSAPARRRALRIVLREDSEKALKYESPIGKAGCMAADVLGRGVAAAPTRRSRAGRGGEL